MDILITLADSLNIPVKSSSSSQLQSMAQTDLHQGVAARVSSYPWMGFSDIIGGNESATASGEIRRFLLLLDHVVDPHNLGALIRTAYCAGVDGILVPKDRSAAPTPVVSKVSAGALEHVRMARITNTVNTIKSLKTYGLWIIGLDKTDGQSIFSFTFPPKVAIVIGGEHKGMGTLVKKHCDELCSIPQLGEIDSLNASVAGAIAMYEVYRQRSGFQDS